VLLGHVAFVALTARAGIGLDITAIEEARSWDVDVVVDFGVDIAIMKHTAISHVKIDILVKWIQWFQSICKRVVRVRTEESNSVYAIAVVYVVVVGGANEGTSYIKQTLKGFVFDVLCVRMGYVCDSVHSLESWGSKTQCFRLAFRVRGFVHFL
jgi:hypothetical protein